MHAIDLHYNIPSDFRFINYAKIYAIIVIKCKFNLKF
jgi:hypothetical protein